jgi:D-sedoheptulose 7-phosphate isomerase
MAVEKYLSEIQESISSANSEIWKKAGELLFSAYENESNVWVAGNGGNFANSIHFATDWSKGLHTSTGKAIKARAIGENSALASAFSNDLGFENQVQHQLSMLAQPDDVAVLMTAGGASPNIINAAIESRKIGLKIIGLTGGRGLEFDSLFDVHVHVPSFNIQVVEDLHAVFGHAMLKYVESKII